LTYEETLQWMYAQLPMYQRQGQQAFKKTLDNILKFDAYLGHSSKQFKSIHVAGTNGKGSTAHMLASVLQESGYKTGLYTSPHLKDFRERIRINGQMMRKNCVINFIKKHQAFLEAYRLSFFEMTVGMAFNEFAKRKVDIAVIEVGLGRRLDSTNIIQPELSIITNIGMDHTQMLGESLPEIAFEKAGIIKPNIPVIIGKKQKETMPVFEEMANKKSAPIYYAENHRFKNYQSGLKGVYQSENIKTVLTSLKVLKTKGWHITEEAIDKGLQQVTKNTGLRGRWDILQNKPLIIADTAHNKDGLEVVLKQLKDTPHQNSHFVLSFVNDKNLDEILPLFPKSAHYYFSKADIPRALDEQILQQKAQSFGLKGLPYSNIKEALKAAKENAHDDDLIFVGGSTFTVAEII
jgi:dihydrofolate synthase/folylpolyglutamate synthase